MLIKKEFLELGQDKMVSSELQWCKFRKENSISGNGQFKMLYFI